MAEPRKKFRIEETAAAHPGHGSQPAPAPRRHNPHHDTGHAEIMQALDTLTAAIAARPAKTAVPANDTDDKFALRAEQLARITDELNAVSADSAEATRRILTAAEEIDQLANTLSAALKGKLERDLAQDIADLVIRIFEASNFQDLIGQRVAKVLVALGAGGNRTAPAATAAPRGGAHYLHGPRLDRDAGHMSQSEIDALFGG